MNDPNDDANYNQPPTEIEVTVNFLLIYLTQFWLFPSSALHLAWNQPAIFM